MKAVLGWSVLALVLLVFACNYDGSKLSDRQRDEVSEIASAEAYDAISEDSRIAELESRIEALEHRLAE